MSNQSSSNLASWVTIVFIIVLILGVSVMLVYTLKDKLVSYDQDLEREGSAAHNLMLEGDFESAIQKYDELIQSSTDLDTTAHLLTAKAFVLFLKPDRTQAEVKEALTILTGIIDDEKYSTDIRGWTLTGLIQLYYQSQHTAVLSILEGLEVLSQAEMDGSINVLERAARTADQMYPSALSKIFIAVQRASQFVHNEASLTEENRTELASEVETLITASYLFDTQSEQTGSAFNQMMAEHYRGIVLSAATSGGLSPSQASDAFDRALNIANQNNDAYIKQWSVYTYFFYAAHELKYGSEAKVEELLNNLVSTYNNLTTADEPLFASFAKAAYAYPESYNYTLLRDLSVASPTFKLFLEGEFGLTF